MNQRALHMESPRTYARDHLNAVWTEKNDTSIQATKFERNLLYVYPVLPRQPCKSWQWDRESSRAASTIASTFGLRSFVIIELITNLASFLLRRNPIHIWSKLIEHDYWLQLLRCLNPKYCRETKERPHEFPFNSKYTPTSRSRIRFAQKRAI